MYTLRVIVVLTLMTLTIPSWSLQVTKDQGSGQKQREFAAWMDSVGLSSAFKIVKIDQGPYPKRELANTQNITHLELQFIANKSAKAEEEKERFEKLLKAYQAKHTGTLAEKIFHEFVQTFKLPRREACVDLDVGEAVYSVYLPRGSSELIVGEEESRGGVRLFSVVIPIVASEQEFQIKGRKQSAPDVQRLTHIVEDTLTTYLVTAGQAKGTKPEITAERDYSYGYLGLNVQGIKGLVTDKYWEWMSIEVQYHNDLAPDKSNVWKFSCSLHVKYASSANESSPDDADVPYAQQVVNLRNKLVDQLQKTLEKSTHD